MTDKKLSNTSFLWSCLLSPYEKMRETEVSLQSLKFCIFGNSSINSILKNIISNKEKNDKIVSITNSNWIKKNQISQYSFPKANHKIFNFLNKHDWNL